MQNAECKMNVSAEPTIEISRRSETDVLRFALCILHLKNWRFFMNITSCQQAFGAWDKTSRAMSAAVKEWFELYYRSKTANGEDPCQRIAYTVVSKLVRNVFAEYQAVTDDAFAKQVLSALNGKAKTAVQLALVGGECYLKPWTDGKNFRFTAIPRDGILIFSRDAEGEPNDVGTMERSTLKSSYYTLLERRTVDENGYLTIQNRLFHSYADSALGQEVPLRTHPSYRELPQKYTYPKPTHSVGLVRVVTPMLNCVDGSPDGVSAYAAAVGLIHAIDQNEYQLSGEFDRGQSRVFASTDLLRNGQLENHLFVGLDEDPQMLGLTVFSPQLREQSFLARKQEYLRNIESVIGLKRGMLCDANMDMRTATEISASEAEMNLTVMDFQGMWEDALRKAVKLCACLGQMYDVPGAKEAEITVQWGNGILFDEE